MICPTVFLFVAILGFTTAKSEGWTDKQQTQQTNEYPCNGEPCASPVDEENNKFASLFQQMLARQRALISIDCQETEECPDSSECLGGKCRSINQRRTKMINLYSRW